MSSIPSVKHYNSVVSRGGGPPGYLEMLRRAIGEYGSNDWGQLLVVDGVPDINKSSVFERVSRRIRSFVRGSGKTSAGTCLDRNAVFAATIEPWMHASDWFPRSELQAMFDCDLLVVHSTFLARHLARMIPRMAKLKLVLITHSPTYIAHQTASDLFPDVDQEALYAEPAVQRFVEIELETMEALRAVIWPCPEAQAGYPGLRERAITGIIRNEYAATGVYRPDPRTSREALRMAWGIAAEEKVALFIGRAHPHKGFDRFMEWANHCRLNRAGWVFVFAGAAPQTDRDLSAIRQVGYISDNGAAYQAADLVLLPNKFSYLDIGLLEAMSLGAKLAISPTGGHAYVAGIVPSLATIPEGPAQEVWPVLEEYANRYGENPHLLQELVAVWNDRFSPAKFVSNHIAVARKLLSAN